MVKRRKTAQTSLVLKPGIAFRRPIFLHFFDLHFLEERGEYARSRRALAEMDLAVRFSVLLGSRILVPAASYKETDIAASILRPFIESELGSLFALVGSGGSLAEFCAEKIEQYRPGSLQHKVYSKPMTQETGWARRTRSSTKDIAGGWLKMLESDDIIKEFHLFKSDGITDKQLESAWRDVPGRLGREAFIVPHLLGMLPLKDNNLVTVSRLHRIVNREYFGSFAEEYDGAVFQNMNALGGDLIPSSRPDEDIDFAALVKICRVSGTLAQIRECPIGGLEQLAFDPMFNQAFAMSQTSGRAEPADRPRDDRIDVDLAILTALPKEREAVEAVFGQGLLISRPNDKHLYKRIEVEIGVERKVIIVATPPQMGNARAAVTASALLRSFKPEHIVMVGIAGGCPNIAEAEEHVRLGDVVIGSSVFEYDYIKKTEKGQQFRDSPQRVSYAIMQAAAALRSSVHGFEPKWTTYRDDASKKLFGLLPDIPADNLYNQEGLVIPHPHDARRGLSPSIVHVGRIAAGDTLLKDPIFRDLLRDSYQIRAVEMESAGLRDAGWASEKDIGVVRGIVDYCDLHKSDEWHMRAAISAASVARAVFETLVLARQN